MLWFDYRVRGVKSHFYVMRFNDAVPKNGQTDVGQHSRLIAAIGDEDAHTFTEA
jgi:hypothetical protein